MPQLFKLGGGGGDNCNTYSTASTNLLLSAPDVAAGTNYSWSVTAQYNATTVSDATNGETRVMASTPTLTVVGSPVAVPGATYPSAGSAASFTVSGADLTGDVSAAVTGDTSAFQWKVGSGSWGSSITLPGVSGGVLAETTISVRLKASVAGGTKSATVTFSGGGLASNVTVTVNGTVTAVAPTVGTPTCTDVTVTGATLGGTVSSDGGTNVTAWGVVFSAASVNADPTVGGTGCTNVTASAPGTGAFTVAVSGLTANTAYKWKAYAVNSAGTGYTVVQTVTTLAPTLSVSSGSVTGMEGVQYQDGTAVDLSVGGTNLLGNVTVAVTNGPFEVSTDGGLTWGTEKVIAASDGVVDAATVKVRIVSGSLTGPVSGWLSVTSPSASPVEVSLAGSVSEATVDTGTWLGLSYLVLNGDWYNGTGAGNSALPASLGYLTTLTLGGQVQTAGQQSGTTYPAYMTYSIDDGAETTVALNWFKYVNPNNYFGMGGDAEQGQPVHGATTLDLSGLSGGEHTLHVYFSQPTSVGSGTLYDNSSTKVTYNVTFVIPAWNGPNTVYWRDEAVDGHFVRQDGDGNHDPWWYQITPTVGFHNPNMTNYGPNDIIFNNNIQVSMTNDAASTVNSITFTSSSSSSRTIRGSQTLTVNSSITNVGGTMNFRVPLAFGGDVTVTNSKSIYFYSAVNGNGHTLTKKGSGVLYIANAVTVGGATVAAGRLALNVGGSLSSDVSLTASSAVLSTYPQYATNVVDYAGVISGTGQVLKQGAGTTTLSGNNTYSGKTSVTNGTLIVGHANALGSGKSDVHVGLGTAKLKVGDGVTRVAAKSLNFIAADSELVTGAGKVVAVTNNAAIKKVTFDAGNYSGEDTQWAIVTSSSGTITQSGDLTVVNGPATGTCELELSGDGKTLYVTYHKPPAAPVLTVSQVPGNAAQLSVTATPPGGASVVVVRNETGTFAEQPSGSTLPSVDTDDWAGGKVVSVTSGTFTDGGLTGCTTYYYAAWSLKNGLWSAAATDDEMTVTPVAPTGLAEGTVTSSNAVLTWTAAAGAGGYLMDIAKGSSFGGGDGAGTVVASADFSEFTAGGTVDISESLGSYGMTGWTGYQIFTLSGYARLGTSKTNGYVTTPDIESLPAGTTISFKVKQFNDKGGELNVWVWDPEAWDDETSSYGMWVTVGNPVALSSATDWTPVTVTTTVAYAETPVSFDTDYTLSEKRCYIDDIVVTTPGSAAATYVTADGITYEKHDVGNVTNYTVERLEEDTAYAWRLYTYGGTTNCASDASAVDTFATPPDSSLATVTIANFDAAGASAGSNVAAGGVLAGGTALLQGTKLEVAPGAVNPVLTGVSFVTTGSATGSDIGTFRVRIGTTAAYAGNETLFGMATGAAAGTQTVSGSASMTQGTTNYLWIEAVTLAGATAGHGVAVGALTTNSFTMTGARKSGGTAAAGTQTIYGAPTVSLTPGAVGSAKISGTVSGLASGATVELRCYTNSLAASEDTAGTDGTAVTVTAGAFDATGLEACRPYWFKARQTLNGYTGAWGAVATEEAPGLTAPPAPLTGTATGAHSATLSWGSVAGASGYSVNVWHFEGEGISGIEGTYSKITTTNDLTDGNYLIVGAKAGGLAAMSNTLWGTPAIYAVDVSDNASATSLEITTNDAAIVWHVAYDGTTETWSFKNEAYDSGNGGYAASSGSANAATISGALTDAGRWKMGVSGGLWAVTNVAQSGRKLQYNSGNTRFACYTSGQASVMLFKQTGGAGTRVDDVIANGTAPEATAECTVSGTGATLTKLAENTTYHWSVAATGFEGCPGDAATGPTFKTDEMLGEPTITPNPLTAGVEGLSGTVSGASGGSPVVMRYADAGLAQAATTTNAAGGTRVTNVTAAGEGTWSFADTNLLGCKEYYYRAWVTKTIDEVLYTSSASTVVTGRTDMATPVPTGMGAGTSMTISWPSVPGATNYTLQVSDRTNTWTALAGDGTEVFREEFAGVPGGSEASISQSTFNTYTTNSGWVVSNAYGSTAGGYPKMGAGGTAGYLESPPIAALTRAGTVKVDLMAYNKDKTTAYMELKYAGGDWETPKNCVLTNEWQMFQMAVTNTGKAFQVRVRSSTTSNQRFYVDNFRVEQSSAGSGGRGMFYNETAISPVTMDGLELGSNYWFKVIAHGEECSTEGEGWASTKNVPLIEVFPPSHDFGEVERDDTATNRFTIVNIGSQPLMLKSIGLDGSGYYHLQAGGVTNLSLAAHAEHAVTVTFAPTNSGTHTATLQINCNAYNVTSNESAAVFDDFDVELTGSCHDPSTEPPSVFLVDVEDGMGIEDTITDHALAFGGAEPGELPGAEQPVLTVLMWHYNGMWTNLTGTKAASWSLMDPTGRVVLANQPFTGVEARSYGGKSTCMQFTAPIPNLGAEGAVRGTYTVAVSAWDKDRNHEVSTNAYVPAERGWLLDDFTRADRLGDGAGALEDGWVAQATDGTPGTAAIHNRQLELYGPNGDRSGTNGLIAVKRDMSDVGYEKQLASIPSTVSWGFHFRTEGETAGFDNDSSTAGAFVLGAAESDFFSSSTAQKGYAVAFTNDQVSLVRFTKGWTTGGTRTALVPKKAVTNALTGAVSWTEDEGAAHAWTNGVAGKTLAVRVDYVPFQEAVEGVQDEKPARMRLYVAEVAGTGGNPLNECGDEELAATVFLDGADMISDPLPYAGMVWNHGQDTGSTSAKKWGLFDDLYFPHQKGQEEPAVVHVIDEDTDAPVIDSFNIGGAVAASTAASAGLSVTGMVHDASGIWASGDNAPTWTLYVNDEEKGHGTLSVKVGGVAAGDGAAVDAELSGTIASTNFVSSWRTTNCVVVISAWDHDRDRAEDSLEGVAAYRFTLCDATPVAPTWATVEADGQEMVVVRWSGEGANYVVLRSGTPFGSDALEGFQGTTNELAAGYSFAGVGEVAYIGSGAVAYKSGGSTLDAGWRGAEILVAPGSSNYVAVAGVSGSGGAGSTGFFFSKPVFPKYHAIDGAGVPVAGTNPTNSWPVATKKYANGEGVDSFAYRTTPTDPRDEDPAARAVLFSTETNRTGNGWSGAWTGDTGKWKIHDGNLPVGDTDYPDPVGNKLYWVDDSANNTANSASLTRMLENQVSGDFFVSAIVNYQYGGPGKFLNVALIGDCTDSGGTSHEGVELASFGKQGDKGTGDWANRAKIWVSGYYDGEEHLFSETTGGDGDYYLKSENEEANSDYVIVGQVSPTAGVVRMWAYYAAPGGGASTEIPQIWDATNGVSARTNAIADWYSAGVKRISKVTGIRVQAGCIGENDSGGNAVGCIGAVYVDEVRFSTSWENLFSFDKPEVIDYSFGANCGTNEDETIIWKMSDGELAHAEVAWTNLLFDLYHRTGVAGASFTVLDEDGNVVLKNALTNGLAGTTDAAVDLQLGTNSYWSSPVTNAAIATNRITLTNEYTVQVTLESVGGRSNTVSSSTGGGGGGKATDLFIGEYGEGSFWDKYIELYNGTGRDLDLYDYYIFRPKKDQDWSDYSSLIPNNPAPFSRLSPAPGVNVLKHKETIVLLNYVTQSQTGSYDAKITNQLTGAVTTNHIAFTAADRLKALTNGLHASGANYLVMTNAVLDAGGEVPYLLIAASNFNESAVTAAQGSSRVSLNWLDACGLASNVFANTRSSERYIMSRKETAPNLPRSKPDLIDPEEWEYRDWGWPKSNWRYDDFNADLDDTATLDPTRVKYTNAVATAGQYDRNIGLAGNLVFQVFDDDETPPEVGAESGVLVGGTNRAPVEGSKVYTQTGWSFTDNAKADLADYTEEQWNALLAPSADSRSTANAHVKWSPVLGTRADMVATNGGQAHVEFNGQEQLKRGELYIKCNRGFTKEDTVWIAFDQDMQSMTERTVAFGYDGGSSGFSEGWVEWSETGTAGSWTHPEEWDNLSLPTSGYSEWAGSIEDAGIPVSVGHLHIRVCLRAFATSNGAFRLDNFRVEGAPQEVIVTDEEVSSQLIQFRANVHDESGLVAGETGTGSALTNGARFAWGLTNMYLHRDVGGLANSSDAAGTNGVANTDADGKTGRGTNSVITWSAYNGGIASNGLGKSLAQTWFTNSSAGLTQLKLTVADADDDRSGDAMEGVSDFGMLTVVDDDSEAPMLELTSMKPRKGTWLARWRTKQAYSTAPTHVADGLTVANLDCQAGVGGNVTTPKTMLYSPEEGLYALQQTGWKYNTKYWRIRMEAAGSPVTITNIQFQSRGSSAMAPAQFTVALVKHPGTTNEASLGSLGPWNLATGGVWTEAEAGEWVDANTGAIQLDVPADTPCELRITGTGVTATNFAAMNATWRIFDLQVLGGADEDAVDENEAYTYLTDHSLAQGTNAALQGYMWDPGSGLAWTDGADRLEVNPRYVMTKGVKAPVSGELAFAGTPSAGGAGRRDGEASYSTNNLSNGGAKGKTAFKAELPLVFSYTNLALSDFGGTIYAGDADDDRRNGTERVDQATIEDEFAFGVVDQDLVGPCAPSNIAVNGLAVSNEAPNRFEVVWTNKPVFYLTFDEAEDIAPTVDHLTSGVTITTNDGAVKTNDYPGWRTSNHVEKVSSRRKAAFQTGVSGVGEYRVARASNDLSSGWAFAALATNGALVNYGFESYTNRSGLGTNEVWKHDDPGSGSAISGINEGDKVGGVYPAFEGTNSFYLRNGYSCWQDIAWTNTDSSSPVTVSGSVRVFKRANTTIVTLTITTASDENFTSDLVEQSIRLAAGTTNYPSGTWLETTIPETTLASDSAKASFLRVRIAAAGGTANIDDVRLSVKKGSARPSLRYEAQGPEDQGLAPKWLFAVDADNDRRNDRMTGTPAAFYTPYDITPPTPVSFTNRETGASTDHVDDPTTQFDLYWYTDGVGPDDPANANHPTGTGTDVLSPWKTYRVYYRTYDEEFVKTNATSGTDAYIEENLVNSNGVPQYHDTNFWKHVEAGDPIEDPAAKAAGITNYTGIGSMAANTMRLYDLENDEHYLLVVVGVDKAGNEGPATNTSWTVNNTIKFSLIRGWQTNRDEAVTALAKTNILSDTNILTGFTNRVVSAIQWSAAGSKAITNGEGKVEYTGNVTKDYDLLSWDARSFQERPDNDWKLVGSVHTNWFVDDGGPTNRGSIRFYRASYKDRWRKHPVSAEGEEMTDVDQKPLVSAEVYAQTAVPLRSGPTDDELGVQAGGRNYVALHGEPYTNTFRAVFGGTNEFPGGDRPVTSTTIDFYPPGSTVASNRYWLKASDNQWYDENDDTTPVSDVFQTDPNFFTRGFSIDLPYPIPANYVAGTNYILHEGSANVWSNPVPYMLWKPILKVPTNKFSQTIRGGWATNPVFTIAALRLPTAAHPSDMNLTGMTQGQPWAADQIFTIDPVTRQPGMACYRDSAGVWRFAAGNGLVPAGFFKPNDVLVIMSRNGGTNTWPWTYDPANFYTPPDRHMGAGE